MLQSGSVDYEVAAFHRAAQPVLVSYIAEEEAHRGVGLCEFVLFVFVTAVRADRPLLSAFEEGAAKRASCACEENCVRGHRFVLGSRGPAAATLPAPVIVLAVLRQLPRQSR